MLKLTLGTWTPVLIALQTYPPEGILKVGLAWADLWLALVCRQNEKIVLVTQQFPPSQFIV